MSGDHFDEVSVNYNQSGGMWSMLRVVMVSIDQYVGAD